jgi:hypothetical protein
MNRGLCESWYPLESPTTTQQTSTKSNDSSKKQHQQQQTTTSTSRNNNCSVRLKIRFCQETIHLDERVYARLSDYLLDERQHKHLCLLYDQIVPSSERAHFVHALLRYFIVRARIVAALRSFLSAEIARSLDLATLFRPATLCTSLMDQYMRVRCHRFLVESLEVPLSKIGSNNGQISFELDPSKCTDPVQREHNLVAFKSAIRDLVTAICSPQSVAQFPVELKHLFWMVRHQVHAKWLQIKQQQQQQCSSSCSSQSSTSSSREQLDDEDVNMTDVSTIKPKFVCPPSDQLGDDKLVRVYCVSAFVFLRLLCPAMISPKNFGLKFAVVASKHQQKLEREFSVSNGNTHNNANRFDYASLGAQFNVFSPSFLFDLQPSNFKFYLNNLIFRIIINNNWSRKHSLDLIIFKNFG